MYVYIFKNGLELSVFENKRYNVGFCCFVILYGYNAWIGIN